MTDPLDSARRSLAHARRNGDRVATIEVDALTGLLARTEAAEEDADPGRVADRCPSRRKGRRCIIAAGHDGVWHHDVYVQWDNDGRTRAQIAAAHPPPLAPLRLHYPAP